MSVAPETRPLIATGEAATDHILVALRSSDHDAWPERGLLDALRRTFHIPMTIFEIDQSGRVPPAEPQR